MGQRKIQRMYETSTWTLYEYRTCIACALLLSIGGMSSWHLRCGSSSSRTMQEKRSRETAGGGQAWDAESRESSDKDTDGTEMEMERKVRGGVERWRGIRLPGASRARSWKWMTARRWGAARGTRRTSAHSPCSTAGARRADAFQRVRHLSRAAHVCHQTCTSVSSKTHSHGQLATSPTEGNRCRLRCTSKFGSLGPRAILY